MKAPDCHVRESNLGCGCDFLTRLQKSSLNSPCLPWLLHKSPYCSGLWLWGKENLVFDYLLSDDVGVMAGLDFEGAIVRP